MMSRRLLASLIVITLLVAAVLFAPMGGHTLWLRTLHNFAHVPIFGAIALVSLLAARARVQHKQTSFTAYLLAFMVAAGLGAATEVAQSFTGRDASWLDLGNDLLGASVALAVFAAFDSRLSRAMRRLALAVGLIALAIAALPLVNTAGAYLQRAKVFPVIGEFEHALGTGFISTRYADISVESLPLQYGSGRVRALRIDFHNGAWPGIEFTEPPPDWRGYGALSIDAVNPSDTQLDFTVRIDDFEHTGREADRFNRRFALPARTRTVFTVPLTEIEQAPRARRFDLARVRRVIIFRSEPSEAPTLHLVRIALVP